MRTTFVTFCVGMLAGLARPVAAQQQPPDSSKVYTYVERMPVYPGGGLAALTADLRREFLAAGGASDCATRGRPVFVRLVVGPSGAIYDVMSYNKATTILSPTAKPALPALPAACEAAIAAAGHKLARAKPGSQNGRRVAVELLVKLVDAL